MLGKIRTVLAAIVLVFTMVTPAWAAPGDVITVDDELSSAAGLAADPARGVYWIAPAADRPELAAVTPDGLTQRSVNFDAPVSDIQAVSSSEVGLFVADIGDDRRTRASIRAFRVNDPDTEQSSYTQWNLYYPDGPANAKAMAVSPRGNMYVFTFGAPGGIYLASTAGTEGGDYYMTRVGDAPAWVTDATFINPETVAFRTYQTVGTINMYDFVQHTQEAAPEQPRGEALSLTLDGAGLLMASRESTEIVEVGIPQTWDDTAGPATRTAPSAQSGSSVSPLQSPTPTPTPEPTPEPDLTDTGRSGSQKTIIAIVAAVGVSTAAAIVAYVAPDKTVARLRRTKHAS